MRLNPKRTLIIVWTVLVLIVLATVTIYLINFKSQPISNKTEDWARFGDYIGGILNSSLAILNLVVVSYISFTLAKLDDNRNQTTLRELARPLGSLIIGDYEDCIEVKLKNCGLGPLIISTIKIYKGSEFASDSLIRHLPTPPLPIVWTDFVIHGPDFIVSKECEINLAKVEFHESTIAIEDYKKKLRQALSELSVEIKYKDMYNQDIGTVKRDLSIFKRLLN